jgi:hypothetical protein
MTELTYAIGERRICWPNPDATCLHGGCMYCDQHPFRTLAQIERYARKAGVLPHRGKGEDNALHAFQYGFAHGFFNVETRASYADVKAFTETLGAEALRKLAEGMRGSAHGRKKSELVPWLLRYRRDVLDESFRLSRRTVV